MIERDADEALNPRHEDLVEDPLGDEVKRFESIESERRMMPGLPVCARLDGRAFHTLCRGLLKPWDPRMAGAMLETTRALVGEFQAQVGYTQSDEITLIWRQPDLFGERYQKYTSVLPGFASSVFVQELMRRMAGVGRESLNPCFDCRVWQVPSREEAIKVLYWREADSVKNSVNAAAHSMYGQKEVHGKSRSQLMDMLMVKGVNWNDYPAAFRRGTYLQRVQRDVVMEEEVRLRIPEKHRPPAVATFARQRVDVLDLPPLRQVLDAVDRFLPLPVAS